MKYTLYAMYMMKGEVLLSYDLYFYPKEELVLSDVIDFFKRLTNFTVSETESGIHQFWYENQDTGVYFSFDYNTIDEAAHEEDNIGLSFNLNYNRPTFFALEAMPYVKNFATEFSLLVVDTQDHEIGGEGLPKEPNVSDLIDTWKKGNLFAVSTISQQQGRPPYLPLEKSMLIWEYQMNKEKLQESIGDDIFVPTLCVIRTENDSILSTAVLWPYSIPQVFPKCEYIIAMREKKNFFGRSKGNEMSLISFENLLGNFGAYLESFSSTIPGTKVLKPNQAKFGESFFKQLSFAKKNLYEIVAMDSFVDIKPE